MHQLFRSVSPTRPCLRIIVIAAEGMVTEPEYFVRLKSFKKGTSIAIVDNYGNGSDPVKVLDRMRKYLKENPLEENDEAWIVVDQDRWTSAQMAELRNWVNENPAQYHIAVSKKKFEHWLKLHTRGDEDAEEKYNRSLSGKDKHIPDGFINKVRVQNAVERARRLATTSRSVGNIYELVEKFLS